MIETTRNIINVSVSFPQSVFSLNRTYSSLFLVHAFGLEFTEESLNKLVNTYLDDFELKHVFNRPLFFLIETQGFNKSFYELDASLKDNKNFRYTYIAGTYEGKLLVMYVYECPDEYRADYDRFLRGEYSKFSTKYKSKFSKIERDDMGQYHESPLYGVITKSPVFRRKVENYLFDKGDGKLDPEQEVFGIPDRKIEVFRYPKEQKNERI